VTILIFLLERRRYNFKNYNIKQIPMKKHGAANLEIGGTGYGQSSSLERFRKLNENISVRADEAKAKAGSSSLLAASKNPRKSANTLRSVTSNVSNTISIRADEAKTKAGSSSLLATTRNPRKSDNTSRSVTSNKSNSSSKTPITTKTTTIACFAKPDNPKVSTPRQEEDFVLLKKPTSTSTVPTANCHTTPKELYIQPQISMNDSVSVTSYNPQHNTTVVTSSVSTHSEIPRGGLDLKCNDDAFESIAGLLVENLSSKINMDDKGYLCFFLNREDIDHLATIAPMSVRLRFVDALRYRLASSSQGNLELSLSSVIEGCVHMGFDRDVKENVLLGGGVEMSNGFMKTTVQKKIVSNPTVFPPNDNATAPYKNSLEKMDVPPKQINMVFAATGPRTMTKEEIMMNGIPNITKSEDSNKFSPESLPDDMKWMIYAGLTPEQMQVTMNAMNSLIKESKSVASTTTGDIESKSSLKEKILSAMNPKDMQNTRHDSEVIRAPEFVWRDGLSNIFANGVMHPFTFLSFVAPLLAAGQIMTRMECNYLGYASTEFYVRNNFYYLISLVIVWLVMNVVAIGAFYVHWARDIFVPLDIYVFVVTNLFMYLFSVFVIGNTRRVLRNRYKLPQLTKYSFEDFVLTAILMPFVVAQMGRHTVNYNDKKCVIFSSSGLERGVKLAPPRDSNEVQPYRPPFV